MFHRGGTLNADNSLPVPSRGASYGVWKQDSLAGYTAKFRFLRRNPRLARRPQKVVRSLALAADANSFTGTLAGQVLDAGEAVVQPICGSETGQRAFNQDAGRWARAARYAASCFRAANQTGRRRRPAGR